MKKTTFALALMLMLLACLPAMAVSAVQEPLDHDPILHFDCSSLEPFDKYDDATAENGVITLGANASTGADKQKGTLSTNAVTPVQACNDFTVFTAVKLSGNTDTWITLLSLGTSNDTALRIMAVRNTIYAQHSYESTNKTPIYTFAEERWIWIACTVDYTEALSNITLSMYISEDMGATWSSPYTVENVTADVKPQAVSALTVGKGTASGAKAEADYAFSVDDIRLYDGVLSVDELQTVTLKPVDRIGIQTKQGKAENTVDVRFLATVDSLRYDSVGLEITMNYRENGQNKAKRVDHTASVVYHSVLAAGETVTAREWGGRYLLAFAVSDIPTDLGVVFTVKAFASENGERKYADVYELPLEKAMGYSRWTLDAIGENGLLTDSTGLRDATAYNCVADADAINGSSLLLQPTVGGNISFGRHITDTLCDTGAITFAFWYYPKTTMLHRNTLLQLSMQDGKEGVAVWVKGNKLYVSCRSSQSSATVTNEYDYDNKASLGAWQHLALALDYNTGTVHIYQNGVEMTAKTGSSALGFHEKTYNSGTPKYADVVGGATDTHFATYLFSGRVDEIYLYPYAMDAEGIAGLYAQKSGSTLSETQQSLYSELRAFTNDNTVLSVGSNIVLTNEDRRSLVPHDATPAVLKEGNTYYAPVGFFSAYYPAQYASVDVNQMGQIERAGVQYWSVGAFADAASVQMAVSGDQIILGARTASAELKRFIADYYSAALELLPVPEQDAWSSRVEIQQQLKAGSPSITALSNGTLLASYDLTVSNVLQTNIERSTDGGRTWELQTSIKNLFWATLFELDGTVYIMGVETTSETNREKVAIAKSIDGGATWSSLYRVDTTVQQAHHAPTPAVVYNGRVYIAFEERITEAGTNKAFAGYRSYMMSAPVNADLTAASSWTKSNLVGIDISKFDATLGYGGSNSGFGICEGNAVAGPDGIYIALRVESDPATGLAYMLKLSEDNTTLTFHKVISLPVGKDKFVIRYDAVSEKYIAIGNSKQGGSYPTQRNILSMYWSTDLESWNYAATLIADNTLTVPEISAQNYGYQYPDFIIQGDDILMVVREASGTATYFHDANCITFYTIQDYKQFLQK